MVVRKYGRVSNIKVKWYEFYFCCLLGFGIFVKVIFDFIYLLILSLKIFFIV